MATAEETSYMFELPLNQHSVKAVFIHHFADLANVLLIGSGFGVDSSYHVSFRRFTQLHGTVKYWDAYGMIGP